MKRAKPRGDELNRFFMWSAIRSNAGRDAGGADDEEEEKEARLDALISIRTSSGDAEPRHSAGDDEAARRAQKMKEKEDKKKALAEKRAARDAARKAKKAGEGGDA